ncbi:MAG: ABC-ATPase domain-containing protein [Eubacteriales bacterium]|nr:ABC-ATPase domain-containing protein [Eubacteriales bacterium]
MRRDNRSYSGRGGENRPSGRRPDKNSSRGFGSPNADRGRRGSAEDLRDMLYRIDHRGYPAYKDLQGSYDFGSYVLGIDHVQGDPFAAPTSVSVHIKGSRAGFPDWCFYDPERPYTRTNKTALEDFLIRKFHRAIGKISHEAKGSGKSGLVSCSDPGQEVLERSALSIDKNSRDMVFRLSVGFPAAGRTVLARELEKILFDFLPDCVGKTLFYHSLSESEVRETIELAEDRTALRDMTREAGLIAFAADGALLPRESGISQKPMNGAKLFTSPEEDRVEFTLPNKGKITGMGIRPGVTLIIGGGYHGKSTLLEALERGVYDHVAGDGREFVMTDPTSMKVRAEDGRSITDVDISPFIRELPDGRDTSHFSSLDASGSTSQAASVIESIEAGAKVLLMDEDTCATNFMVCDDLMRKIVNRDQEPIQPYNLKMRGLYREMGISTILVAGSSGAFFAEADRIIQMDRYEPYDVTDKVRKLVPLRENGEDVDKFGEEFRDLDLNSRRLKGSLSSEVRHGRGGDRVKHKNLGSDGFMIGHSMVDLRALSQIVDGEQTELLAVLAVGLLPELDGRKAYRDVIDMAWNKLRDKGFSSVFSGRIPGNLAMVRPQEIYASLNRCRLISANGRARVKGFGHMPVASGLSTEEF